MPRMTVLRRLAPNLVTALALVCGIAAIQAAVSGDPLNGTWWVMWAIVFDKLDGALARWLNTSSALGAQFDSFADFTSFGLAPFFLFEAASGRGVSPLTVLFSFVYVLGCVLRLARYNLDGGEKRYFCGVPSPMAAGIPSLILNISIARGVDIPGHALLFSALLALFGVLMNLPWLTYQKIGTENSRVMKVFVLSVVSFCFVLMLLRRYPEFLLIVSSSMMISGPILRPFTDRRPELP